MGNGLVRIIEGVTPEHFIETRNLLDSILSDMGGKDAQIGPCQVSMRLNESGEDDPSFSYFVGFVQNEAARQSRENLRMPDPGLFRFGDDVVSREYRDSVKRALAYFHGTVSDPFVTRDWTNYLGNDDYKNKAMGTKSMDILSGVTYRKYIGILINNVNGSGVRRCVGQLAVGYPTEGEPLIVPDIDDKLKIWAQGPADPSSLIKYLNDTFELGGPICQ